MARDGLLRACRGLPARVPILHIGEFDARRALGGIAEIEFVLGQEHRIAVEIVGDRHYVLASQVQGILQKYDSLKNIIAIIGKSELSVEERRDYDRALKLIEFFNQSFHVAEDLNGEKGEYVSRDQTLLGVEEILLS